MQIIQHVADLIGPLQHTPLVQLALTLGDLLQILAPDEVHRQIVARLVQRAIVGSVIIGEVAVDTGNTRVCQPLEQIRLVVEARDSLGLLLRVGELVEHLLDGVDLATLVDALVHRALAASLDHARDHIAPLVFGRIVIQHHVGAAVGAELGAAHIWLVAARAEYLLGHRAPASFGYR